jgi:hypothetical protein
MTDPAEGKVNEALASHDLPVQFFPLCSRRLESRHCKLVCPRCEYLMPCSEFDRIWTFSPGWARYEQSWNVI